LVNTGIALGFTTEFHCFLYVVFELQHAKSHGEVKNAHDWVTDRQLPIREKKRLLIQAILEMDEP
jgi:hypothetical protein